MGFLDKEYEFYQKNKQDIISQHQDRYVVIVGEKIVGVYDRKEKAVVESVKKYKMGTFLVQHVAEQERVVIMSRMAK